MSHTFFKSVDNFLLPFDKSSTTTTDISNLVTFCLLRSKSRSNPINELDSPNFCMILLSSHRSSVIASAAIRYSMYRYNMVVRKECFRSNSCVIISKAGLFTPLLPPDARKSRMTYEDTYPRDQISSSMCRHPKSLAVRASKLHLYLVAVDFNCEIENVSNLKLGQAPDFKGQQIGISCLGRRNNLASSP
jgi:hypothetical protein